MIKLPANRHLIVVLLTILVLNAVHGADAADVSRDAIHLQPPRAPVQLSPSPRASTADNGVKLVQARSFERHLNHVPVTQPGVSYCCDDRRYLDFGSGWDSPWQCGTEVYWARLEYLNWDLRGSDIPALISTSPVGTLQEDAGILGDSATTLLLGNRQLGDANQSGGRAALGFWLDDCHQIGFEYTYTGLDDLTESFQASSDTSAILARPFFNAANQSEDARLISFPNELSGQIQVDYSSKYAAHEVLLLHPLTQNRHWNINFAAGYRSSSLDDTLGINDSSLALSGITTGTLIELSEQFKTRNEFHGFEAGLLTRIQLSRHWRLDIDAKVAFGETDHSNQMMAQSLTTTATGQTASSNSGLLVQTSNQGTHDSSSHSVQNDLTINLRRHLRWGISGNIGYSIHHWTNVARAGEQIDRWINPTQIPPGTLTGAARPKLSDTTSDFIAQGLTAGLEWTW